MRLYTWILILLFSFALPSVHAGTPVQPPTSYISADPCGGQYNSRVIFVNGVWNHWESAAASTLNLAGRFWDDPKAAALNCIDFELGYNHKERYIGDLLESGVQWFGENTTQFWLHFFGQAPIEDPIIKGLFDVAIQIGAQQAQEAFDSGAYLIDEDLQAFSAKASEYTADGKRVLIVAHSQGNFYANQVYRLSSAQPDIAIAAVATPAPTVEGPWLLHTEDGDFGHVTLDGDFIHSLPGALDPNSNNGDCGSPFECHAFINSYLAGDDSRGKLLSMMFSFLGPSTPPNAQDDTAMTVDSVPVDIDVLANDIDPDGDALTITAVTQGASGSASLTGTGVTYTPNAGFLGTDIFTYTVSDGNGGIGEATVTVTVVPASPSTTFVNGDIVEIVPIVSAVIFDTAGGVLIGGQDSGAIGEIVGGPDWVEGYWWWQVNFDDGADGWVVENYLQKVTPTGPGIIYSNDFSTDPNWSTDQPNNYYWDSASGTFIAITENAIPSYSPNRYALGNVNLDPTKDFSISWDQRIIERDGYGTAALGLYSDDLESNFLSIRLGGFDSGQEYYGFGVVVDSRNYGQGGSAGSDRGGEIGVWFSNTVSYVASTSEVTWQLVNRATGSLVLEITRPITASSWGVNALPYLAVTNNGVGESGNSVFGLDPTDYQITQFDNVVITGSTR